MLMNAPNVVKLSGGKMGGPRKTRTPPKGILDFSTPNWVELVYYLIRKKYPKMAIARAIGMTKEKLNSMMRGCYIPSWTEGHALLEWCKHEHEIAIGVEILQKEIQDLPLP